VSAGLKWPPTHNVLAVRQAYSTACTACAECVTVSSAQKWPAASLHDSQFGLKAELSQPLKAVEGTVVMRLLSESIAMKMPSRPSGAMDATHAP